jgi:alpha-1,3-rhamnosyl/mannosyltransferase
MVGSIEPRKNHATVLEAYAAYHAQADSPRPLHLVGGRGWHSDKVHARMAELQNQGLPIRYAGYVDDRELRATYQSAYALLQPSWHEGFGLPVLEAFSQGLPVMASDRGSLPEVSNGTALHCPADQPAAWAQAMSELDQDINRHASLVTAGLRRADDFSWQKTAKTVLELAKSPTLTSPSLDTR